ncbi:hypothetical protein [Bradyrhizobium sp. Pha-3]|uniref:hypothetical protein n=1 Tax=Bradyrhizobium TaxID=374 RepID=UPI0035D52780
MITYHRNVDGQQVADAEALDARGVIRPGYAMRTAARLMDGAPTPLTDEQRQALRDEEKKRLSNAWRDPSAPFRRDAAPTPVRDRELAHVSDQRLRQEYQRYEQMIQDAWKQP